MATAFEIAPLRHIPGRFRVFRDSHSAAVPSPPPPRSGFSDRGPADQQHEPASLRRGPRRLASRSCQPRSARAATSRARIGTAVSWPRISISRRMVVITVPSMLSRVSGLLERPHRRAVAGEPAQDRERGLDASRLTRSNTARPHRALGQVAPDQAHTWPPEINLAEHWIRRKPGLSGLTNEYQIAHDSPASLRGVGRSLP